MRLRQLPHRMKPCYDGTETKVQDLPIQILAEVFDYVQPLARQKLRAVCMPWNYIIGQLFPIALRLNNTKTLAKTAARFIELNITAEFHSRPLYKSILIRLRKLELQTTIFNSTHLQILRRATNLEELVLNSVSFRELSAQDMTEVMMKKYEPEFKNWLPALQILKIDRNCCKRVLKLLSQIVKSGKLVEFFTDSSICTANQDPDNLIEMHQDETSLIIQEIIQSNHSTLRNLHGICTEFQFHPWQIDQSRIYRKFTGTYYLTHFGVFPLRNRNWLQFFQKQKNLKILDIKFWNPPTSVALFGTLGLVIPVQEVKAVVSLTMGIITGSANFITKITLTFSVDDSWFRRESELKGFDRVFGLCVSLKHLQLDTIKPYDEYELDSYWKNSYDPVQQGFTGLATLPKSLKFFHLSFPILSSANSLRDLDLSNLENLESLILDPVIWLIFTETGERINSLTINHVKQLKSKLPKLKRMSLNVANHGTQDVVTGELSDCKLVTPGLLEKFKMTLKHNPFQGIYLNINF